MYLNGELLGSHRVYYEPFRFDVTGKLQEQNTLAVRVIDGRVYGEPMAYWGVFPDIRAAEQRYVPDRAQSDSRQSAHRLPRRVRVRHPPRRLPGTDRAGARRGGLRAQRSVRRPGAREGRVRRGRRAQRGA